MDYKPMGMDFKNKIQSFTSKTNNFFDKWGILILSMLFFISVAFNIWQMYNSKETFCTCQGAVSKHCPKPKELVDLYNDGILTENSKLIRGGGWKDPMPYDIFASKNSNRGGMWIDPMPYDMYEKQQFNIS
jgi:hypothetical protein